MTSPQDPEYTSEPKVLSPVSPKPVHYPVPSNIPILANQIDPIFNQTATHMAESASQQLPPPLQLDQPAVNYGHTTQTAGQGRQGQAQAQAQAQAQEAQTDSQTNQDSHVAREEFLPPHPENAAQQSTAFDTTSSSLNDDAATSISYPSSRLPHDASSASAHFPQSFNPDPYLSSNPTPALAPTSAFNGSGFEISNMQSLVDKLSQPIQALTASPHYQSAEDATSSPEATANDALSSLPPRPPPQDQPLIHPSYNHSQDIRDFHPHSQQAQQLQQSGAVNVDNAGNATGANGLPAPPVASFQQHSPSAAQTQQQKLESQREMKLAAGQALDEDDAPWTPETQHRYDIFLTEERKYVTEGNWEQFPYGSRLFVGNLSSERVTKRDIFHVFHKYGDLAQISIKQAYGFVQFLESNSCSKAIQVEQGKTIRGKKIHLEVSKPQKNRTTDQRGARRSRSPDRAANSSAGPDRYPPGDRRSPRDRDRDRNRDRVDRDRVDRDRVDRDRRRGKDDYRPGRSPSPPPRQYRSRDRSRDRYEGRYRSRSRSPQYGRGGRFRSPSPRRRNSDDDLPLPRRVPRDVPDVQIIVLDELDRNFIAWLEHAFTSQGIRVDVLLLSPRLSEAAVVRRQIIEGVLAVSRITRINQQTAKIPLQVFDRRQGVENVRFEEYDNLDPTIAAQLVLRAKAATSYPPQPAVQYGYGAGVTTAPPNISNIITSLDNQELQKLLGVMQPPAVVQPPTPHHLPPLVTGLTPDLAKLLSNSAALHSPHPHLGVQPPQPFAQHPPPDPLAALRANPGLAGLLAQSQPPAQRPLPLQLSPTQHQIPPPLHSPRGQPDMADILAKLGSYRR